MIGMMPLREGDAIYSVVHARYALRMPDRTVRRMDRDFVAHVACDAVMPRSIYGMHTYIHRAVA